MKLDCKLAIRLLNFDIGRCGRDLERIVVSGIDDHGASLLGVSEESEVVEVIGRGLVGGRCERRSVDEKDTGILPPCGPLQVMTILPAATDNRQRQATFLPRRTASAPACDDNTVAHRSLLHFLFRGHHLEFPMTDRKQLLGYSCYVATPSAVPANPCDVSCKRHA